MKKKNYNLGIFIEERGAIEFVEGSYLFPTAFIIVFIIIFSTIMLWDKVESDSVLTSKFQIACNTEHFNDPYSISNDGTIEIEEVGILPKKISLKRVKSFKSLYPFRNFQRTKEFRSKNSKIINWTSPANDMWHMQAIKKLLRITEKD